jgi:hypothetical protein
MHNSRIVERGNGEKNIRDGTKVTKCEYDNLLRCSKFSAAGRRPFDPHGQQKPL